MAPGPQPESINREALGYVIDVLRGIIDEEHRFTERLSTAARQAFALAAAFVALAQSVAFGGFRANVLGPAERKAIIGAAIVAILFVVRAAFATVKVDRFIPDRSLSLGAMEDYLNTLDAPAGDEQLMVNLVNDHLAVAAARRTANTQRGIDVKAVRLWVGLALLVTAIELVIAVAARA
jgi:hypothetical protein